MSGFVQALPFVLRMEGGYVNDPIDRGGATNMGVTQATYDAWRKSMGQGPQSVKDISEGEVEMIYHRDYWVAAKCDALPWPVSLAHFDAAVNHGVGRAARMLQEVVGVAADGAIGPKTLAAVAAMDPHELLRRLLWRRLEFYYAISDGNQGKFLRGWLRRVLHLEEATA